MRIQRARRYAATSGPRQSAQPVPGAPCRRSGRPRPMACGRSRMRSRAPSVRGDHRAEYSRHATHSGRRSCSRPVRDHAHPQRYRSPLRARVHLPHGVTAPHLQSTLRRTHARSVRDAFSNPIRRKSDGARLFQFDRGRPVHRNDGSRCAVQPIPSDRGGEPGHRSQHLLGPCPGRIHCLPSRTTACGSLPRTAGNPEHPPAAQAAHSNRVCWARQSKRTSRCYGPSSPPPRTPLTGDSGTQSD